MVNYDDVTQPKSKVVWLAGQTGGLMYVRAGTRNRRLTLHGLNNMLSLVSGPGYEAIICCTWGVACVKSRLTKICVVNLGEKIIDFLSHLSVYRLRTAYSAN